MQSRGALLLYQISHAKFQWWRMLGHVVYTESIVVQRPKR
jgi:hypothetical protein